MSFRDILDLIYEDNHCLAVNKPAGWPSAHYDGQQDTVDLLVRGYLKEKYQKPGKVFLGVVQRLDKPVTGVLLFARTSKAASRIAEQFRSGAIEKVYWAVVEKPAHPSDPPLAESGFFEDWLVHNDAARMVQIAEPGTWKAQRARTDFRIVSAYEQLLLLELRPHTGRKHQLRVQCAARGMPIFGDRLYGSQKRFGTGIGLHARQLTFLHPIRYEPMTLHAELNRLWRSTFAHLLGRAS